MLYRQRLATALQDTYCPFCNFHTAEIIAEGKYFFVIPARAPYSRDHILIIPKRHVIFLKELKKAEEKELRALAEEWDKKLQQHHSGCVILLRDAFAQSKTGKSIDHLHLHVIPDCEVGVANDNQRSFFSDGAYLREAKRIKGEFLS
ncbi:MAG: HIT domain-containing protein [Candidatus Peribacteria bacterium]|jgi:diadenosine tetraphosphate (Ap4A) HIT family hydrolase|nr:HIT domain-containing protein [Candidatus Peribacteria bacterium]